jgi:multisubunit Na+/H+ antiporter MnhB subunit
MLFSIGILLVIVYIAFRIAPREKKEQTQVHGAGQIAMLAALALFGADFFSSYFYGTGEMMSAMAFGSEWGIRGRCDCICEYLFWSALYVFAWTVQ